MFLVLNFSPVLKESVLFPEVTGKQSNNNNVVASPLFKVTVLLIGNNGRKEYQALFQHQQQLPLNGRRNEKPADQAIQLPFKDVLCVRVNCLVLLPASK